MLVMRCPCSFDTALQSVTNLALDFPLASCQDPFRFTQAFHFFRDVFVAFLHLAESQLGLLFEAQPEQDLALQSALAESSAAQPSTDDTLSDSYVAGVSPHHSAAEVQAESSEASRVPTLGNLRWTWCTTVS